MLFTPIIAALILFLGFSALVYLENGSLIPFFFAIIPIIILVFLVWAYYLIKDTTFTSVLYSLAKISAVSESIT